MSSNSDSKGGAARRSAIQSICVDEDCAAFGKTLGNGYCRSCCFNRGVPYKPQKNLQSIAKVDPISSLPATKVDDAASFLAFLPSADSATLQKRGSHYLLNAKPIKAVKVSDVPPSLPATKVDDAATSESVHSPAKGKVRNVLDVYFVNKVRESVKSV